MDWLAQAASKNTNWTTTSPDEQLAEALSGLSVAAPNIISGNGGGLAWLTAATSSGHHAQGEKKKSSSAQKPIRRSSASTANGGWITSGRLGTFTGDESDDLDNRGVGKAESTAHKPKSNPKESAFAASGSGGWLAFGGLGIPVNSDSDEEGHTGGANSKDCPLMASVEAQTDDDIEGIVKRGEVPKVLPWAKRWTPPPEPILDPEPTIESSSADDAVSDQEVSNLG